MKIGIDLRVLQVGHQYRGIGEVAKRVSNELFVLANEDTDKKTFIFFEYDTETDPKQFLDIPADTDYEVSKVGPMVTPESNRSTRDKLAGHWRLLYGEPLPAARRCDVLLQFDYVLGVSKKCRTVLIKHDIIPLLFWSDYFTSPWLHVKHKAARTTLKTALHNYEYKRMLARSLHRAWKIVCVSEHTRKDILDHFRVSKRKISVSYLGVSLKTLKSKNVSELIPPTKPYLLFIGAIDARRRRVDDLIAAYNNLKADGNDIQLVLVGENFKDPKSIPNKAVRDAVLKSSYAEDILTYGYIDDDFKYQLFRNAVAFVFPTTYEGFGIPVLESMLLDCPVITYRNSSVLEIAKDNVLYAKDWESIMRSAENIMKMDTAERSRLTDRAKSYAQSFTWERTGAQIYDVLTSSRSKR